MKKEEKNKSYGVLFVLSLVLEPIAFFWNPSPEHDIYYFALIIVIIIKDVAYYMRRRKIKNRTKHSVN